MSAQPFSGPLCDEINLLRSNPSGYVQYLQEHMDRFVDDMVYKKANGNKIRTKEGVASKFILFSNSFTITDIQLIIRLYSYI